MLYSTSAFSCLNDGQIPICVFNGCVKYCYPHEADRNLNALIPLVGKLPKVKFQQNYDGKSGSQLHQLYLSQPETVFRRIQDAWFERGLKAAVDIILEYQTPDSSLKKIIKYCTHAVSKVSSFLLPFIYNEQTCKYILHEYTLTRDWKSNPVRYLIWHPHCTKFAVATSNDCVIIYSTDSVVTPILKHHLQSDITCIAFRPLSTSEIAVGCAAGVYLWNIDPSSVINMPSLNSATLFCWNNHKYVTSIAWNDEGNLLATCSVYDRSIYVWDVLLRIPLILTKFGGGSPTLLSWSPDSNYLFSNTQGIVFRIWFANERWKSEKWYTQSGRVKTACWSPCSNYLLFSITSEPTIFVLNMSPEHYYDGISIKSSSYRLADVSKCSLACGTTIGGEIVNMAWDKTGKFLALMFKDTDAILLFSTVITDDHDVHLTPKCVIKGRVDEVPSGIGFQNNFIDGTNLLIVWSSGRAQYFPCLDERQPDDDNEFEMYTTSYRNSANLNSELPPLIESF